MVVDIEDSLVEVIKKEFETQDVRDGIKKLVDYYFESHIDVIDEHDEDYKRILQGRENRKINPQDYVSLDDIKW